MDLLFQIKNDIQKYAETIFQIINIHVEVMNKDFIRIAGTGELKNKIGMDMEKEADIYKRVLKTGKTVVITDPRENEACLKCVSRKNCREILEVSVPIIFNSETIGVIGLICFEENQKNNFMEKKEYYIGFLEQMAEFISSRVYQENEKIMIENNNKVLLNVVDRIPNGIIITNEHNKVELINETGTFLFGKYIPEMSVSTSGTSDIFDKKEFFLTCNGTTHEVVGDIIDFPTNMGRFRTLYIFQEAEKFREYIQHFNNNFAKDFIFTSPQMQNVYLKIQKVAKTTTTTLITGESGTGKEVVAKAIHMNSNRADGPFIPVNCGAIPESLIESEFFGYSKGAFTGANPKGKIGFFEQADGGTIFLDEIGDMPLSLQVKLLRVLQEKTITPIGSNKIKKIDIRIIAATNKNLEELVSENRFREDLYYRLNVIPISILPLRERKEDIIPIINNLIYKYNKISDKFVHTIEKDVLTALTEYNWPGNVRELENVIELMINMSSEDGVITKKMLPENILNISEKNFSSADKVIFKDDMTLDNFEDIEKKYIEKALSVYGNDTDGKKYISEKMNIGLTTLYRKMKKYNIK